MVAWHRLRRTSTLVGISLLIGQAVASAAHAQSIAWQVDNPFRFYRYKSDFEIQRWAYRELSDADRRDNPVSKIERKLNHPKWWDTLHPSGQTYKEELAALRKAEGRQPFAHDPRLGWASLLRPGRYDTCWRANLQTHKGCSSPTIDLRGGTYLDPKAHAVTIWRPQGAANQTCRWSASQPIFPAGPNLMTAGTTQPCDQRLPAIVPAKTKVQLTLDDGTAAPLRTDIEVRDLLIVGLGDSYSSGEGNPDVPVPLDPANGIAPAFDETSKTYRRDVAFPRRRSPDVPAQWLDRKCHRSIYAWQARTALAVALQEPQHQSVAFLSLACSGAEVLEGMLYPYEGRETLDSSRLPAEGRDRLKRSQLDAIVDELCMVPSGAPASIGPGTMLHEQDEWVVEKPSTPRDHIAVRTCPKNKMRSVDLLLLSIGGNDVGFSRLIADTVAQNGFSHACVGRTCYSRDLVRGLAKVVSVDESRPKNPSATVRLEQHLPPRYEFLKKAFAERLKLTDDDPKRIVFVGYPSPLVKTAGSPVAGNLCGTGRDTMTVSEVYEIKSADTIRKVHTFVEDKLIPSIRQLASGWTWVDGHRERFVGHGFCSSAPDGPNESGGGSAEKLAMPHTTFLPTDPWKVYDPRILHPYESRARWFRTFNDDYVITNYAKRRFDIRPLGRDDSGRSAEYAHPANLIEQTLGGPMHPTAEGHSHMADAATKTARDVLKLGAQP